MSGIRALHIASFNGNIGDNANHKGFRRKLKEELRLEITFDEIEMREFYKSWEIRDFNSSDFIETCNRYDIVIIGGGNFFELKWDYSHTGTTVNFSSETLDRIETPIFFHGLGCDIGKGASDLAINRFSNFLDKVTSSDQYMVSVRNDGSMETLHHLYGNAYDNKVHEVPDGAFFLQTESHYYPELNNGFKSIGINVVSDMKEVRFHKDFSYVDFVQSLANSLNRYLTENPTYQAILFPHIYSDLIAISDLIDKIDDNIRRTRIVVAPCLTGKGAEDYIFGLYKKCEFILGMRFHSNVCAIAQNIPTIALSSYKKIHDLYDGLDLLERVIYVNEKDFQKQLDEIICQTTYNLESIKQRYNRVNMNIENQASYFYSQLEDWFLANRIIKK